MIFGHVTLDCDVMSGIPGYRSILWLQVQPGSNIYSWVAWKVSDPDRTIHLHALTTSLHTEIPELQQNGEV